MKLKQGEYPEIDLEIPVRNLNKVTPNLLRIKVYKKNENNLYFFHFSVLPLCILSSGWMHILTGVSSFLVLPSTLFWTFMFVVSCHTLNMNPVIKLF